MISEIKLTSWTQVCIADCGSCFFFFTFKPNFSVAFIPLIFLFPNKMQSSFFLRSDDVNWYFKTEHEPRLLPFASCFGLLGCQKEQVLSPCYSGDNVTSLLLNTAGISMLYQWACMCNNPLCVLAVLHACVCVQTVCMSWFPAWAQTWAWATADLLWHLSKVRAHIQTH